MVRTLPCTSGEAPVKMKSVLAERVGTALRILRSAAGPRWGAFLFGSSHVVRVVNYHGTPVKYAKSFRDQIRWFNRWYRPVGLQDLARFLDGTWERDPDRPGLLLTFDDGLRSNYEVAAAILEEFGWRGWFFVPAGLVGVTGNLTAEEARRRLEVHSIRVDVDAGEQPPFLMDWDELAELNERGHVVGAHSMTHMRLSDELSRERLHKEVVGPKKIMEQRLGRSPEAFAWVGGERSSYSSAAEKIIRQAGYEFCFATNCRLLRPDDDPMRIDRTNVEAGWPLGKLAFYLSRLMDAYYWPKRLAIRSKLA
jgi:peptidoglycan/xylan/chitin deacetylase (PgdA/CDA1 family)